jgi:hypothetical protein
VTDQHDRDVTAALGQLRTAEHPDGDPREAVFEHLTGLLPEAANALVQAAERLLDEQHPPAEGRLLVVLMALAGAEHPAVSGLLVRAIESPSTRLKEEYVCLLEELGDIEVAVEALLTVLRSGRDSPRPDLAAAVRAVHMAGRSDAVGLAADLVGAPERAVRGLAVEYLYEFDEDGSVGAPAVLDRLGVEPDAGIVDQIIGALERWDWVDAVPQLEQLAADDSQPHDVRREAALAVGRLRDPS